jgi:hypothetical protein
VGRRRRNRIKETVWQSLKQPRMKGEKKTEKQRGGEKHGGFQNERL